MELQQVFSQAEEIAVYTDGEVSVYPADGDGFRQIIAEWSALLDGSVTMPAFGVSINDYTVSAIKSGKWVEFAYSSQQKSEGMEFEKLLVEVKPDYMGFNVNRYNSGYGYAGRCYYIDLRGKSMQSFYNFLCSELK